jgi:polyhydroxyalkanoate synthase
MVRYLVEKGHTVYMLSWLNPDAADHDLSMDDYLRLGPFDALRRIAELSTKPTPVQAVGYCLGGTLLAIAAAALERDGIVVGAKHLAREDDLLLAAQTDFWAGELGLFIDSARSTCCARSCAARATPAGRWRVVPVPAFARPAWTRRMRST